jgi:pimeloyl-ACP methyl ester carboxylesterase
MAIFVLVHGGFGGSWQWREVIKPLWAAGHEVYAPSLTGLGERAHLANPEINLSTHVQDVVSEITCSDLQNVILVGHSYGGMVITGVADRIPERVSQLVYLDALVPEDGQSYTDLIGPVAAAGLLQAVQAYGDGWKLYNDDPDPRWTPQPVQTGLEKLSLKNPAAARLPRVFISCSEEKSEDDLGMIPITRAAERAKNDPGWRYFEIPSPHNALLDHSDLVVKHLLNLARVQGQEI